MEHTIGFAIVGTGSIADFHAKGIADVEGAKLVGVYSRTAEKAQAFAAKENTRAAASLDELLSSDEVDVVCITTPSGAHLDIALSAFKHGKHVLCEKPLEITTERVDQMVRAANEAGCILGGIFQSRFGPGAQQVKKAIEAGRFGQLTLCSAFVKWWRDDAYYRDGGWRGTWKLDGGGALMNQSIHAVDMLQWLVGMPTEVAGASGALARDFIEAEDTAAAVLKFANGAFGVIEGATSCYPGFTKRVEISGSKGSAVLEDDSITTWSFAEELPEDEQIREQFKASTLKGGSSDPRAISTEGHRRQIENMANAVRSKSAPQIPGEEGRNAVAIIEAIYKSSKSGKFEPVV